VDGLSWACLIVLAITPPSRLLQAFRRWWEGINSRGDQPITPIHKVANWTIWEMGLDVAKGVALVMLLPQLMPLDWIGVGIAGGLVLGSWVGQLSGWGTIRVATGCLLGWNVGMAALVWLLAPWLMMGLNRLVWGWLAAVGVAWVWGRDAVIGMTAMGVILACWGRVSLELSDRGRWWWMFERRP